MATLDERGKGILNDGDKRGGRKDYLMTRIITWLKDDFTVLRFIKCSILNPTLNQLSVIVFKIQIEHRIEIGNIYWCRFYLWMYKTVVHMARQLKRWNHRETYRVNQLEFFGSTTRITASQFKIFLFVYIFSVSKLKSPNPAEIR